MSELSPLTQMTHPLNDLPLQVIAVFVRSWTDPDPCRPQQDIHIRMENISPHNLPTQLGIRIMAGEVGYRGNVMSTPGPGLAPLSGEGSFEKVKGNYKMWK